MTIKNLGPNTTLVTTGETLVLWSYGVPVASRVDGNFYRTSRKFSRTTTSHINKWLGQMGGQEATVIPHSVFEELTKA